jgi:DNA-binding MurR/RpiR family transcriptional regulator
MGDLTPVTKPSDLDQLRKAVTLRRTDLTPRMLDAARFVVGHPNVVALNPVSAVARQAGIAPTAFVRLAKALGYDGFSDLQGMLREPLRRSGSGTLGERIQHYGGEQPLENPSDPADILRTFSRANIMSLEHLEEIAAGIPLDEAIRLIEGARSVHIIGLRRSYPVASYLAYALSRIGRHAYQITGLGGTVREQVAAVGKGDLLIAISFPPYAEDTVKACKDARARGGEVIAITNSIVSPIATGARLLMEVSDAQLLGFRSLTALMCLAQSIAMALAFRLRANARHHKETTPSALDDADC